jgi:hypothetical protein
MTTTIRPITTLALAWMISATPTMAAEPCPAVDSARAMLSRAAAEQNDRDMKQAQPPPQKPDQKPGDKKSTGEQPDDKSAQAPPTITPSPVSAEMQRAALLVKEADDACQAGKTKEATDKAKAAMALMAR